MHNKEEFVEIIKENEGLIYKITKVYASTKEDAQDLYQEIIYQLWKSFGSFRNESKMSTWIYRVALNTSIAHLNKDKRKGNQIPIDDNLLNRSDTNENLKKERIEDLYAQIKKLNTVEKGIILLYLEGKNYDEISVITGFRSRKLLAYWFALQEPCSY
jgi:RNA polymerase sigma-70 factor (ECF subfamily)